jgi:hypothetical protein
MEGFQPWIEYTRFLIALTAVIDPFFTVLDEYSRASR